MLIPLTQGKFAIVGPLDYRYLMQWKWYYSGGYGNGYAIRTDYTKGKHTISMHRVILKQMGYKNFPHCDHVNRDKLDNRRCNLRPATTIQSCYNRGIRSDNTSSYKGVYWSNWHGKWRAVITGNKKKIHLGYFEKIEEAARACDKASLKYHGKFAVLNFPT